MPPDVAPATPSATLSAHEALTAAFADPPSAPATSTDTPTPAPDSPAPATAAPEPTPTAPATDPSATPVKPAGEPPTWRWQDILANTRKTVAEETEARIRGEYAWLPPIPADRREAAKDALAFADWMDRDPQAALKWLTSRVAPATPEAPPEPDLQTADGTPVYSAVQAEKREAWFRAQQEQAIRRQMADALQPLQGVVQAHQIAHAQATVAQALAVRRQDPDFVAHEAEVKQALQADAALWALADRDPALALEIAYGRVFQTTIRPGLQAKAEAEALKTLQQRAVAGTTNPATPGAPAPASTLGNARAALRAAGVE